MPRSGLEQKFWDAWLRTNPHIELIPNYPLMGYEIDFAHPQTKIAIELDSERYHNNAERFVKDRRKDRVLGDHGWQVYRWSDEELRNINFAVKKSAQSIQRAMKQNNLSPQSVYNQASVQRTSQAQRQHSQQPTGNSSRKRQQSRKKASQQTVSVMNIQIPVIAVVGLIMVLIAALIAALLPELTNTMLSLIGGSALIAGFLKIFFDKYTFMNIFLCIFVLFTMAAVTKAKVETTPQAGIATDQQAIAAETLPAEQAPSSESANDTVQTKQVTSAALNLRQSPDATSSIVDVLTRSTEVYIVQELEIAGSRWVEVKVVDQPTVKGWVNAAYLQ